MDNVNDQPGLGAGRLGRRVRQLLIGENMKRGSIALARRLCVEIAGFSDEEDDMDGNGYGSVDIAEILSAEVERLRNRIDSAPVAIMDTRDVLGICAPTEDAFPALYAIQGKRVRLVLDDEVPNAY